MQGNKEMKNVNVAKTIRKINWALLLFSAIFSVMLIVSRHVIYTPDGTNLENTFVTDFSVLDGAGFCVLLPLIYVAVKGLLFLLRQISGVFFQEKRKAKKYVFVLFFLLIMLLWLPYLPSYWPGGIYSDTVDSIRMALGQDALDNHNPILYTLLWRLMFFLTGAFRGETEYYGLELFTVVQLAGMALVMAGFVYWCYRKGFHKLFIAFMLLIIGIFPLYPFYGISLWKDTIFSLVVFLFSVFLYQTFSVKETELSWMELAAYCLFSLLLVFLRNNGIYVMIFCAVLIVLICLKKQKMTAMKIGIASLVIAIGSLVIQGPVYDAKGYNVDRTVESMGIPIQQVAYVLSTDGAVEEDELAFMEQIMPLENWKALYEPTVVDYIKFDPTFDRRFFQENSREFTGHYLHMMLQNPVKALKAYALATIGFWDISRGSASAYICNFHFSNSGYVMSDYFDYYTGLSFRELVEPREYISAALWAWLLLLCISICIQKRYFTGLIALLPTLGVWLSIMVATPLSFSFRYVYSLFLCAPIYLIVALRACRETAQKEPTEAEAEAAENARPEEPIIVEEVEQKHS